MAARGKGVLKNLHQKALELKQKLDSLAVEINLLQAQARQHYYNAQYLSAIALYEQLIQKTLTAYQLSDIFKTNNQNLLPDHHYMLGLCLGHTGKTQEALEHFLFAKENLKQKKLTQSNLELPYELSFRIAEAYALLDIEPEKALREITVAITHLRSNSNFYADAHLVYATILMQRAKPQTPENMALIQQHLDIALKNINATESGKVLFCLARFQLENNDLVNALPNLNRALAANSVLAGLQLAALYTTTQYVTPNLVQAFQYYKQALPLAGNPPYSSAIKDILILATFNMACAYDMGIGGPRNAKLGVSFYEKAIQYGSIEAQYNLGYKHLYGEDLPSNHQRGFALIAKAAKQGHTKAQHELALCYMYGLGIATDYDKAEQLLKQSIKNNIEIAISNLALLHLNLAVDVALPIARRRTALQNSLDLFTKATTITTASPEKSWFNLGCIYENGIPELLEPNSITAADYYHHAVALRYATAGLSLLRCLLRRFVVTEQPAQLEQEITNLCQRLLAEQLLDPEHDFFEIILLFNRHQISIQDLLYFLKKRNTPKFINNNHDINELASNTALNITTRVQKICAFVHNKNLDNINLGLIVKNLGYLYNLSDGNIMLLISSRNSIKQAMQLISSRLRDLMPECVTNIFMGLSKLALDPEQDLIREDWQNIAMHYCQIAQNFDITQHLKILSALSTVGVIHPALLQAALVCINELAKQLPALNAQDLATFMHKLATLHNYAAIKQIPLDITSELIQRCIVQAPEAATQQAIIPLHQYYMGLFYFRDLVKLAIPAECCEKVAGYLSESTKARIQANATVVRTQNPASKLQQVITRKLALIFREATITPEHFINTLPFDARYQVPHMGIDVLFAINGPKHYLIRISNDDLPQIILQITPKDLLHYKLAGKMAIVTISFQEWQEASTSEQSTTALLRSKIFAGREITQTLLQTDEPVIVQIPAPITYVFTAKVEGIREHTPMDGSASEQKTRQPLLVIGQTVSAPVSTQPTVGAAAAYASIKPHLLI